MRQSADDDWQWAFVVFEVGDFDWQRDVGQAVVAGLNGQPTLRNAGGYRLRA